MRSAELAKAELGVNSQALKIDPAKGIESHYQAIKILNAKKEAINNLIQGNLPNNLIQQNRHNNPIQQNPPNYPIQENPPNNPIQ